MYATRSRSWAPKRYLIPPPAAAHLTHSLTRRTFPFRREFIYVNCRPIAITHSTTTNHHLSIFRLAKLHCPKKFKCYFYSHRLPPLGGKKKWTRYWHRCPPGRLHANATLQKKKKLRMGVRPAGPPRQAPKNNSIKKKISTVGASSGTGGAGETTHTVPAKSHFIFKVHNSGMGPWLWI